MIISSLLSESGQIDGWLFYRVLSLFGSLNAELNNFEKTFKQFIIVYFLVYQELNVKTVLFKTLQICISIQVQCQNSSILKNSV